MPSAVAERQLWRDSVVLRATQVGALCGVQGGHEGSSDQVVEVAFDECLEGVEHVGLVGFGSPQHDRHRRVQGSDCGPVKGMNASKDLALDLDEARISQGGTPGVRFDLECGRPGVDNRLRWAPTRSGSPGRRPRAWWGPRTASTRSRAIHAGAAPAAASGDRRADRPNGTMSPRRRGQTRRRANGHPPTRRLQPSRSASGVARSRNAASVGFGSTPVTAAPSDRSRCVTRPGAGSDLQNTSPIAQMTTVAQHLEHCFGIRRSPHRVHGRILSVQFSPRRPARRKRDSVRASSLAHNALMVEFVSRAAVVS